MEAITQVIHECETCCNRKTHASEIPLKEMVVAGLDRAWIDQFGGQLAFSYSQTTTIVKSPFSILNRREDAVCYPLQCLSE